MHWRQLRASVVIVFISYYTKYPLPLLSEVNIRGRGEKNNLRVRVGEATHVDAHMRAHTHTHTHTPEQLKNKYKC